MSVKYDAAIEVGKEPGMFQVSWRNAETKEGDSFKLDPGEINTPEMKDKWHKPAHHLEVGNKLFRFLDGDGRWLSSALDTARKRGEIMTLRLCACKETADWPFELLALGNTFLLNGHMHLVRCVSEWGSDKEYQPPDRPVKILFMACSALDVEEEALLNFEEEEEKIFQVTEELAMDMEVEDTGSLEGMAERLLKQQYDVVHLSGHAYISKEGQPFFIMEDETGYRVDVSPNELWEKALKKNPPTLLFLSGCQTGKNPVSGAEASFARLLVEKYHIPAVLGWGRTVSDHEASYGAEVLYHELSKGRPILEAVQQARSDLAREFTDSPHPAWPLLRLFGSGESSAGLVKKDQKVQPKARTIKHTYLKESRVKILEEGFVGRRRQLQQSLKALKQDEDKIGVLLHGTGGLGKSCLAGKICERFKDHALVVVHGKLNTITLENAIGKAFLESKDIEGIETLAQKKEMAERLEELCVGSFKEKNYFLIFDDFEQNQEGAREGEPGPLLPETTELLKVLLHHLPSSGKMTQIIITGRYSFTLTAQNRDLVKERLEPVCLTSLKKAEQRKKVWELDNILCHFDWNLTMQLMAAGMGNPRLMDWINILVGEMKGKKLKPLLAAVKDKQEDFVRQHVIRELMDWGGENFTRFLIWFSIYRLPVFEEGAREIGDKAGLSEWKNLLERGLGLSLVEFDRAQESYGVTPLIREELVSSLKNVVDLEHVHRAGFDYYKKKFEGKETADPVRIEEWIYHALGCGAEDVASQQGFMLVRHLHDRLAFLESRRVGEWILNSKKKDLATGEDAFLLYNTAATIKTLGDNREAIKYYKQALTIWKKVYGKEHQHVAIGLNSLGGAWDNLGDHRKAIACYQRALAIDEKVYGKVHPQVATALNNLGLAWKALSDSKKAIGYYQRALAIVEKAHGKVHPKVAATLNNLGETWRTLGDPKKAIEYYRQAMAIWKKVYGDEHPNVSIALNSLSSAFQALGDPKKAIEYLEQALDIDEKVYGKEHPTVANRLGSLGEAFRASGDPKKAIGYSKQALEINEKVYGKVHPDVAIALINLGGVWDNLGDHRKAIDYFQRAQAIVEKVYGKEHPRVADALNNMGMACKALGNYKKAIDYYQQALAIDEKVYGKEHPNVAIRLNNLGSTWDALGNPKKAIEYLEQALDIDEKVYGKVHPQVATALNNLGSAWKALGNPKKAIEYLDWALAICKKVYGEVHPHVFTTLNNLGVTWDGLGDHRKAIEYLDQALAILKRVYGDDHPNIASALNNLGSAYFNLGEKQKAKEYFVRAYELFNKFFGPDHPNTRTVAGWLTDEG